MKIFIKGLVIAVAFCAVVLTQARAATVENVTFKDTDIRTVLQGIAKMAASENADINIVVAPDVTGQVTIDLVKVDWQTALKVILRQYNLKAHREKNVIMITSAGATAAGQVPTSETEVKVFNLKYLDANDALKAIIPVLSSGGKVSVLETVGQSGWEFGGDLTKKYAAGAQKLKRTKVLIVSDTAGNIEQVTNLLDQLDVMPRQILIKARIMEINHDVLKDLGFDWGTGTNGATSTDLTAQDLNNNNNFASHSIATLSPSTFVPKTQDLSTDNGGFKFMFQHLTGVQFEAILHALEENTKTNMLSAPLLTTLNNQEATILIGTKYPIIKTDVSTETNTVIGGSLQEYKDIGIQLNVVPQVWGENEDMINLIVHPVISDFSTTADVTSTQGTTTVKLVSYPIINTREAETQLAVKNGGTVMMGGLIKEVKSKQTIGIPFLSKIPLLGLLFKRQVDTTAKVELVIFLTARILAPGDEVPADFMDTGAVTAKFEKK